MSDKLLDTNVIIRFLVEDPQKISKKFRGVFSFFPKVERGEIQVDVPDLVIFESFFVLTKVYNVPSSEAASKLKQLIAFRGIIIKDKPLLTECLSILETENIDLVDAYILAIAKTKKNVAIYSFDRDLSKSGIPTLTIE